MFLFAPVSGFPYRYVPERHRGAFLESYVSASSHLLHASLPFASGPAASVHPRDAEVLDGPREARLGEGELQASVVAGGHPLGQRPQRRPHRGAETEGERTAAVMTPHFDTTAGKHCFPPFFDCILSR